MLAVDGALVDPVQLPIDRDTWPEGIGGEDPRDSAATFGHELLDATRALVGQKLDESGA